MQTLHGGKFNFGNIFGMREFKWCSTKRILYSMRYFVDHFQPERIDPRASSRGYDVRSDVWSLGITLVSTD